MLFTVGLPRMFSWLGENREVLQILALPEARGVDPAAAYLRVAHQVRRRLDALQEAGHLRAGVDLDAAMALLDVSCKGFWTIGAPVAPDR